MRRSTIVVSGFEPFGAARQNPTLAILERLGACDDLPVELVVVALPVDCARVSAIVTRMLDQHVPDVWIGLGLAMGASVICVERIAANVLDFSIPDNAGACKRGEPVFAEGPAAYLATLPVAGIVRALRQRGVPAKISNSASTYLCNQLMYTVLHLIDARAIATRAGFIHVPAHPALVAADEALGDMPSMSLDLMTEAVRIAILTSADPSVEGRPHTSSAPPPFPSA